MTPPPMAVALGDQVHAEISDRAMSDVADMMRAENVRPSDDEQMYLEIGIQAGLNAAMRVLAEHGWIKVTP